MEYKERVTMKIVVNNTSEEIKYNDEIVLDYMRCMDWFQRAMLESDYELYDDTIDLAKIVFDDIDINDNNWRTLGNGVSHLLARLELTHTLRDNHPLVWRLPESGIYPKYHGNIVELMITMGMFNQLNSKGIS